MSLATVLNQQLARHLESMKAIRDANFDRDSNTGLLGFTVLEFLDPATRKAPSKYRVELRGVAIGDMVVKGKSLSKDYRHQVDRFVQELKPRAFDWEPEILDPLGERQQPPLVLEIFLPTDPFKPLAPEVYFRTKVWHPNIRWDNGHTCYGSKQDWADPQLTLADLCRRLYTMTAFLGQGSVNPGAEHFLNQAAGTWHREMMEKLPEMFPLSTRILT
ncbi:MAG: hypothetical protein VKP72_11760 [bacterium]|nr:hypothetical protein [bacterium]